MFVKSLTSLWCFYLLQSTRGYVIFTLLKFFLLHPARGIEKKTLTNLVSSFDKTAPLAVNKFKIFSTHMYLYCAGVQVVNVYTC